MTATTYVVIDQSNIDAPEFPRDASWWQGYLPLWFTVERSWDKPESEWDRSAIVVEPDTHLVVIPARDRRQVREMTDYLARTAAVRFGAVVSVRDGEVKDAAA